MSVSHAGGGQGAVDPEPLILAVAPNGARKTKSDHPAIPMTAAETGKEAAACREAGASMIHLHVRNQAGTHSLDADLYRSAIDAVRREAGAGMIIQVTSEAVGIYTDAEQRAMVRDVCPEAVSLAIRELCPTDAHEQEFSEFCTWMQRESVAPQFILYDADDVRRFAALQRRGILAIDRPFVLFVLGRYSKTQTSDPSDLLAFLTAMSEEKLNCLWAVCAFGPKESACSLTAAALGGHCRIGFENNTFMASGEKAPGNAALISQVSANAMLVGRVLAKEDTARMVLGMK